MESEVYLITEKWSYMTAGKFTPKCAKKVEISIFLPLQEEVEEKSKKKKWKINKNSTEKRKKYIK